MCEQKEKGGQDLKMRAELMPDLDKFRGCSDRRQFHARTHVLSSIRGTSAQALCEHQWLIQVGGGSHQNRLIATDQKDTHAGSTAARLYQGLMLSEWYTRSPYDLAHVSYYSISVPFIIMLVCKFLALIQYKYARKSCSSVVNWPCSHLQAMGLIWL